MSPRRKLGWMAYNGSFIENFDERKGKNIMRPHPRARSQTIATLALFLLAAGSAAAWASSAPVLTLERAIEIAEEYNRGLRGADARLGAAEAGIAEARSHRLPRIDLEGGFLRTDNPVFVFGNLLTQENFQAENFDLQRLNRPAPLDNWKARLTIEQPLWTGGFLSASEQAARLHRDALAAGRERTRQEVIRQVAEDYASAVLARHRLAVASDALATAQAHVRLIGDLREGGLVVESDLLQARVRESEVHEMVIRAESSVEISRAALNLALGRDLSTSVVLPEDLDLRPDPASDLDALIARARHQRPDLRAARLRLAAAESQIGMAKSGKRPRLGLHGSYETNSEDFFGNDGDNWSLAVGLELPLFDGFGTRARVQRARERAREASELAELSSQTLALEVYQGFHQLRAARQRLEQTTQGAELARRSLVMVEDRYKEGLITLPEFLEAETALTAARLRQVTARRDVLLAGIGLDLATGDLGKAKGTTETTETTDTAETLNTTETRP